MTESFTVQVGFQCEANCTDSFVIGFLVQYGSTKVANAMDRLRKYYAVELEVIVF